MFNDRDLGVLGAGAFLAVLCLLLPFSFAGKMVIGLMVLIGFIVLALMRLGPDRIPIEEWLRRRIRFRLRARHYTYQQPGYTSAPPKRSWRQRAGGWKLPQWGARGSESHSASSGGISYPMSRGSFQPVGLALNEIGVYPLASVFLAVIGVYFIGWLAQGGVDEIAQLIGGILR